jgi:drug/metabolite transporter (DMT)-like permease
MRWLKILAVAVAVVIVFIVISALTHILYLIGVGLLIAAALFAAFKGREQYKLARERHEASRQHPTGLPPAATSPGFDVDEELARLKRELPGS